MKTNIFEISLKDVLSMHKTCIYKINSQYIININELKVQQLTDTCTCKWGMDISIYLLKWWGKGRGSILIKNEVCVFNNFLVYLISVLIITAIYGARR